MEGGSLRILAARYGWAPDLWGEATHADPFKNGWKDVRGGGAEGSANAALPAGTKTLQRHAKFVLFIRQVLLSEVTSSAYYNNHRKHTRNVISVRISAEYRICFGTSP